MDWVNTLKKISNKIKFQLFGRNIDDLQSLYANSVKFDSQATCFMTENIFNNFLNASGIFLTTQQIRAIADHYSQAKKINYVEFIQHVRKDISEKRLATIQYVFDQISQNGIVPLEKLLKIYNPEKHPHCRARVKKADVLYQQFQSAITRRSADKKTLNEQQFFEYWFDVNATIPHEREEYFIDILINGLGLTQVIVTQERLRQIELNLYQRIRQKTPIKQDEGNPAKKAFRYFDLQNKGIIDFKRFADGLEKLGCKYIQKQAQSLFKKYTKGEQLLTYEQFCAIFLKMGSGVVHNNNPIYQLASQNNGYITSNGMTKTIK